MTAAEAFNVLDLAGLNVGEREGRLILWPSTLLTNELRALARQHKADLLVLARDAALAVETARRKAREVQSLDPADGGRG